MPGIKVPADSFWELAMPPIMQGITMVIRVPEVKVVKVTDGKWTLLVTFWESFSVITCQEVPQYAHCSHTFSLLSTA